MEFVDPTLPREIFSWHSPRLGEEMPIVSYGTTGHPLLLFPTAAADFLENERFFLIKSIEPHIFAGKVRVFCIDATNRIGWMNESAHPLHKAHRHAMFSAYVEDEVVPHIRLHCGAGVRIATSGASFGAFHAANMLFRRPDLFDCVIAMSGFFDLVAEASMGPHDFLPLVPVVEGAGGRITDWEGRPLTLSVGTKGRVLAAGDPALHELALTRLKR